MSPICRVSPRPMKLHVFPPSVVFQTPSPCETLPRSGYSPPPTYTTSGADGATATAPIVPPKYLSVTGAHDSPAFTDLNTPPPVVPSQNSLGRDGLPVTATERPPRYGPSSRQRTAPKAAESNGIAAPGTVVYGRRGPVGGRGRRCAPAMSGVESEARISASTAASRRVGSERTWVTARLRASLRVRRRSNALGRGEGRWRLWCLVIGSCHPEERSDEGSAPVAPRDSS